MRCREIDGRKEDKEENTPKWPKKGPQRAKNPNFEKQKIEFFYSCPKEYYAKKLGS